MRIYYDEKERFFHLSTSEMSYAIGIMPDGCLINLYWGPVMHSDNSIREIICQEVQSYGAASLGVNAQKRGSERYEIPTREPYDFSEAMIIPIHTDGVRSLRLRYVSHTINGEDLIIRTKDEVYAFEVDLHYKGYADLPLLSRHIVIRNGEEKNVKLETLKSAAFYLPSGRQYRLTHLAGNWGSEYCRNECMLTQAKTVLENNRITCAAAQHIPFFALDENGTATETCGEIYFGVLQWSGDFKITVEQEYGKQISVVGGVGDYDTNYILKPGEEFETPAFVCGYSGSGFERMSEVFYDWQFDHIMPRGKNIDKAHAVRPALYNSWYPYLFDVNEKNCLEMVDKCAELGVELFVIDDGWMPKRVNEKAGLGDWIADPERFPHGMKIIADACHEKGMMFGLWVEPEMVNPDSELYRMHPDWVINDATRERTLQRNQLVLNLARDEVRDWAIAWLDRVIEDYHLDYLKWDMNRYVTENGWPEAEKDVKQSLAIRYTRNLLKIWQHMNEKYPDVLFENCASGGGRSDFGMVPYADRINRSDNADPVDIMVIHEGFSMLFVPKTAGGAGNIAPERHHIHGRYTPLDYRICWGMAGSLSIGVNILTASEETMEQLKQAIINYKKYRADLQDAYVYRIASARTNPYALFQYVRRDRKAFTLFTFAYGMRNWDLQQPNFKMRGLIPDAVYVCEDGTQRTGESLMNFGLELNMRGDFYSKMSVWRMKE